jgi:hypothetical protein
VWAQFDAPLLSDADEPPPAGGGTPAGAGAGWEMEDFAAPAGSPLGAYQPPGGELRLEQPQQELGPLQPPSPQQQLAEGQYEALMTANAELMLEPLQLGGRWSRSGVGVGGAGGGARLRLDVRFTNLSLRLRSCNKVRRGPPPALLGHPAVPALPPTALRITPPPAPPPPSRSWC